MLFTLAGLFAAINSVLAQGTAFTYQGRLSDTGQTANGSYDLTFALFNVSNNGSAVAGPITKSAVAVSNGLFTVTLDFGANVFTGDARWLQVGVRTNGGGAFTTLSPRQPVLPVPYALYAMTPAGPAGPQGPPGPQGATGATGATGVPDHIQIFLSNGTFVVPTNVTKIMVELWGGGGGGGSGYNDGSNAFSGGGGGAGGYAWNVFNVTPNTNYSVVVGSRGNPAGAGGTSSFGSLLSATGGTPGASATISGPGAGGIGGVGSASSVFPMGGGMGHSGDDPTVGPGVGGQVWRANNAFGRGGDGAGGWNNISAPGAVLVYY